MQKYGNKSYVVCRRSRGRPSGSTSPTKKTVVREEAGTSPKKTKAQKEEVKVPSPKKTKVQKEEVKAPSPKKASTSRSTRLTRRLDASSPEKKTVEDKATPSPPKSPKKQPAAR